MPDSAFAIETLKHSRDPRELARAAQVLAGSARAEDQQALLGFLKAQEFRQRLDPPHEADTGPDDLWIAKPLRTLETNAAPSAHAALVELMGDGNFTGDLDRVDLLVQASAVIHPPVPAVVQFWRKYGLPGSVHLNGIMTALMDNGDPVAVAEFERILLTTLPDEEAGDPRPTWLHGPMLRHRDNLHVLAMAERLVTKQQPAHWTAAMRMATAESLFLHRAGWYRTQPSPLPPPRAKTPKEGRATLRRIADYVEKNLRPSPALKSGIAATRTELDAIDAADK